MIFEWYSGSDQTGQVPKKILELSQPQDDLNEDGRMETIQELLDLEGDRNWRGFLLSYLAHDFDLADDRRRAIETFRQALDEFDLIAGNFRDVEAQYASTLYSLVRAVYAETDETETVFEYALRLLPHISSQKSGGGPMLEPGRVYNMVGEAIYARAVEVEDVALYRIALEFIVAAHHAKPDDPDTLARIAYAQYGAGNESEAKQAFLEYERLEEATGLRYQHAEKLREFMYSEFPNLLEEAIESYRTISDTKTRGNP